MTFQATTSSYDSREGPRIKSLVSLAWSFMGQDWNRRTDWILQRDAFKKYVQENGSVDIHDATEVELERAWNITLFESR